VFNRVFDKKVVGVFVRFRAPLQQSLSCKTFRKILFDQDVISISCDIKEMVFVLKIVKTDSNRSDLSLDSRHVHATWTSGQPTEGHFNVYTQMGVIC
jgi:hypothetical protein